MSSEPQSGCRRVLNAALHGIVAAAMYVLSSGPILGLAFWLREATGVDQFYFALWLYAPLFLFKHDQWVMRYVEWWVVDVFHTVGPG